METANTIDAKAGPSAIDKDSNHLSKRKIAFNHITIQSFRRSTVSVCTVQHTRYTVCLHNCRLIMVILLKLRNRLHRVTWLRDHQDWSFQPFGQTVEFVCGGKSMALLSHLVSKVLCKLVMTL